MLATPPNSGATRSADGGLSMGLHSGTAARAFNSQTPSERTDSPNVTARAPICPNLRSRSLQRQAKATPRCTRRAARVHLRGHDRLPRRLPPYPRRPLNPHTKETRASRPASSDRLTTGPQIAQLVGYCQEYHSASLNLNPTPLADLQYGTRSGSTIAYGLIDHLESESYV